MAARAHLAGGVEPDEPRATADLPRLQQRIEDRDARARALLRACRRSFTSADCVACTPAPARCPPCATSPAPRGGRADRGCGRRSSRRLSRRVRGRPSRSTSAVASSGTAGKESTPASPISRAASGRASWRERSTRRAGPPIRSTPPARSQRSDVSRKSFTVLPVPAHFGIFASAPVPGCRPAICAAGRVTPVIGPVPVADGHEGNDEWPHPPSVRARWRSPVHRRRHVRLLEIEGAT